jgi:hypothetical protein
MRSWRFLRNSVFKATQKFPCSVVFDIKPFTDRDKEFFFRDFAYLKDALIKKADRILEHKIELFGKEISFSEQINWHLDYVTKYNWPLKKSNYGLLPKADPKYVWELNRHQFLPILAKAFFLTGDKKYADEVVSLITSWIEQNPPFLGINWFNALEPALRQISWLWSLKYLTHSNYIDEKIIAKIRQSLFTHTDYISRNLSLYSSANNHLIGELASVAMVSMHLGLKSKVKKALNILKEQINQQILEDGVGAEQSISYQLYTMEYYLLTMLYLLQNNIAIASNISKIIEQAAIFIKTIIDKNGGYPDIGDNDSGCVLKLSENYPNSKTILNLAAYVTGNIELLQGDVGNDEKLFWLLGAENFKNLIEKGRPVKTAAPMAYLYNRGGYCVFEKNNSETHMKMLFDFGPLGLPPLAGHGHADALSFMLYINEQPVFIDPGTYSYNKSFWRNYFRGTSAHNTIRIDGQDQSVFAGRFLAAYHAKTEYLSFENNKSICARHYGYRRLKQPVLHTRIVHFSEENTITITDILETKGKHLAEQFFHLDKSCKIKDCGENVFKIILPQTSLFLKLDQKLKTMIYYGNEILPLGWQSGSYGSKEKTFSIVGRIRLQESKEIITQINF